MVFNRLFLSFACALLVPAGATAQLTAQLAPDIRIFSDEQARKWITNAILEGLPDNKIDELCFLALNHPRVAIPLIGDRLIRESSSSTASSDLIRRLSDTLAYTADIEAVGRLAQAAQGEELRFGYYIDRALDYSVGRRNPYVLAYEAVDLGNPVLTSRVVGWVETSLAREGRRADLMNAVAARHGGSMIAESVNSDPLVSKLRPETRLLLKRESPIIAMPK